MNSITQISVKLFNPYSCKKIFRWVDAYPQGGPGVSTVKQMVRRMGCQVRIPGFHVLAM